MLCTYANTSEWPDPYEARDIDRLASIISTALDSRDKRIAELEEALKPFSEVANCYQDTTSNDFHIAFTERDFDNEDPPITVGYLRRARAALGADNEG